MKTFQIVTILVATLFAVTASANGRHVPRNTFSSHNVNSLVINAGFNSQAASGSGAGGSLSVGNNSSASVTTFAANSAFTTTAIGFGGAEGSTDTSGMDLTVVPQQHYYWSHTPSGNTGSEGETDGEGETSGLSITSVSGSTSNAGATGFVDGRGSVDALFGAGGDAASELYVDIKYKKVTVIDRTATFPGRRLGWSMWSN